MPPKNDKKPGKPEKPPAPGWNLDPIELLIILLFVAAILGGVVPAILKYFTSGSATFFGFRISSIIGIFTNNAWFFKALGFMVAGASAIGIFTFNKKADAIWALEKSKLFVAPPHAPISGRSLYDQKIEKWSKIVECSESSNSSDWRVAIIEADIMLDELLYTLKLPGETIGDKLKAVEPSDFLTLDQAWEAHKARNMIAHEGTDFLLNQREVRRIISLYGVVFKEFHII